MTHRCVHRARHHGRADGGEPRRRRGSTSSGTTGARRRSRSWSRRAAAAPTTSPSAVREADVVITMVPDSPDVEDVAGGADGVFANAREAGALHRHEHDPARRRRPGGRGGSRGGRPGARRAGLRRRGGRGRGQSLDHGRRLGRGLRGRPGRCSTRSARRSSTSGPAGSGQTVKAANQLIVAGNIQLLAEAIVFLEAYGVDTAPALEVLGGGLAGSTVLARKGTNMLGRRVQARVPARAAPQGHGHRDLGRPRGGRRRSRSARSSPSSSRPWWPAATARWTTPAC